MAMPCDDPPSATTTPSTTPEHGSDAQQSVRKRIFFSIPAPVKRVFDKFPLVTYSENELPLRAPRGRDQHLLHVFTTAIDADDGKPSFNPGCLKWQAQLAFSGIQFRNVPSTNHASPSGALPFLLPAVSAAEQAQVLEALPGNKLKKWIASQAAVGKGEETADLRYEAYVSLLESSIRKAWLYQLYLNPSNSALVHQLYITPCSSNPFVELTIAYQLQRAAETELLKASTFHIISEADLMRDADEAFSALSTLLGQEDWFFGQGKPALFDATVFSYTHLLLDGSLGWQENKLVDLLRRHENVTRHRARILESYF